MEFRDATIQDLPQIVRIYNSTVSSRMVTADTEPVNVEGKMKWFEEHSPGSRPLWVIENNQSIIGWVSFQSFYGRPAYQATAEISIYLDESMRGKGLGKEILDRCMKACGALGIKTLLGFIFAHNAPSIRLFKNAGFLEWANLPNIAVLDNVERSLIILGKRLTQ